MFLTPFCNQKLYFCVFWPFYAQILTKNPQKTQKSKNNENYGVFHKSTKCFNIQLGVEKYFLIFRFCFWPLFVTKNGILRFSAFGLIKWSLIKNSKWNYPQFWGCGSENFIRLNFQLLFVTKNGILHFPAFGLIKWSWIKNNKWNYPQFRDYGSKNFIGLNFFVDRNYFLCFFQLLAR